MPEPLTKEYFDSVVKGLATKEDLTLLATKDDLHNTEAQLKEHAEGLQAELAGMIERTVNVTERVSKLESDVSAIKQALHI